MFSYDSVAQLDRAFGYEPKGRVFESLRGHQLKSAVEQPFHGFLFCPAAAAGACLYDYRDELPSARGGRKQAASHLSVPRSAKKLPAPFQTGAGSFFADLQCARRWAKSQSRIAGI